MSGTDSNAQPPAERQTNRTRRFQPKLTPRAKFPLITVQPKEELRTVAMQTAELDTSDPAAGGGRGFWYQWEDTATQLHDEIQSVAAGGGISYTHHQTTPASTWVIDHHMGLIPNVLLLDGSGRTLIAEIQYPSDQTILVVHSAPYSGTAYLRP